MSRYVAQGPLQGENAENFTIGSSDSTLTAGTYDTAKTAVISVTDANAILITVKNDAGTAPSDGSKGIYWEKSYGPFVFHGDLSKILIRRSGSSDCAINVNYFHS